MEPQLLKARGFSFILNSSTFVKVSSKLVIFSIYYKMNITQYIIDIKSNI